MLVAISLSVAVVTACWVSSEIYFRLKKGGVKYSNRSSKDYKSHEEWLFSRWQKSSSFFPNPPPKVGETKQSKHYMVTTTQTAATPGTFDYRTPPKLRTDGLSHFNNILGDSITNFLFKDLTIITPPTKIKAPVSVVWNILVDIENYSKWNTFQRKVDVVQVEDPFERVLLGLNINLGPVLGDISSFEEVFLCDEERHVLSYGVGKGVPNSLRVIWLEEEEEEGQVFTVVNSYDVIGGYPAIFSRGYIQWKVSQGFKAQHQGLKQYSETVVGAQEKAK